MRRLVQRFWRGETTRLQDLQRLLAAPNPPGLPVVMRLSYTQASPRSSNSQPVKGGRAIMRTVAFVVAGAMLAASSIQAQTVTLAPDGISVVVDGQPFDPYKMYAGGYTQQQRDAVSAFFASQPAPPASDECYTPYASLGTVCPSNPPVGPTGGNPYSSASAESWAYRYVVVQASVGQVGRELTFVVLLNLEPFAQNARVEYTFADGSRVVKSYLLRDNERLAIGLHTEPEFAGAQFFSVTAYFAKAGALELAWHRASDFAQVDTKAGMLVPKQ